MGYYTLYSLSQPHKPVLDEELSKLIATDEAASEALDLNGDSKVLDEVVRARNWALQVVIALP